MLLVLERELMRAPQMTRNLLSTLNLKTKLNRKLFSNYFRLKKQAVKLQILHQIIQEITAKMLTHQKKVVSLKAITTLTVIVNAVPIS